MPSFAQALIQSDGLELKVRRLPDSVELIVQGAGLGGALEQQRNGAIWSGEIRTDRTRGLKVGPQSLAMPDAGLERITFEGTGRLFQLKVTPVSGQFVAAPVISSDGRDLMIRFPAPPLPASQSAGLNLSQPSLVARPTFVPTLRPRAVAPPLGDMAVGSMLVANRSYIKLSGPPVTMNIRGAKGRDVLMVLAQFGGYGYAYQEAASSVSPPSSSPTGSTPGSPPSTPSPDQLPSVTVSFKNENFERAFNTVLLSSGLQARKEGNTIFVGRNVLSKTFGPSLSKVYRLNQVGPNAAADYLANLGAQVTKTFTTTTAVSEGTSSASAVANAPVAQTTSSSTTTDVQTYGASTGPLVGLQATTDTRLGTITLVGDPALVVVAEHYLRQLDLRQRQVALSVKILDVSLNNDSDMDNSFALRFGNNFIVNDGGQLLAAFGRNMPPTASQDFADSTGDLSITTPNGNTLDLKNVPLGNSRETVGRSAGSNRDSSSQSFTNSGSSYTFTDTNNSLSRVLNSLERLGVNTATTTTNTDAAGLTTVTVNVEDVVTKTGDKLSSSDIANAIERIAGTNVQVNKVQSRSSANTSDQATLYGGTRRVNPGLNYPDQQFFDFLRAQIVSSNTKILASPTLMLQEGDAPYGGSDAADARISVDGKVGRSRANEAFVRVGTQLVTSYEVKQDINGNNFCQPVFGNAGLTFGAKIDKIDDNGFVTFGLSPEISAAVGTQGAGNCGNINIINDRLLDTGRLRVRDGQTLILTGVISESDRQVVSKWPIMGDLPLIGQFFRRTSGERSKNELVIMVTPRIISDTEGGTYGYGYEPSTKDARQLLYGASRR